MSTSPAAAVTVVLTTAPDPDAAAELAGRLVDERLAACANIVPGITSIYRWRGKVQRDEEVLVILKTTPMAFEALRRRIIQLHPYEVPEVLALAAPEGSEDYMRWVGDEVTGA